MKQVLKVMQMFVLFEVQTFANRIAEVQLSKLQTRVNYGKVCRKAFLLENAGQLCNPICHKQDQGEP